MRFLLLKEVYCLCVRRDVDGKKSQGYPLALGSSNLKPSRHIRDSITSSPESCRETLQSPFSLCYSNIVTDWRAFFYSQKTQTRNRHSESAAAEGIPLFTRRSFDKLRMTYFS
jgi:hypothetical protein